VAKVGQDAHHFVDCRRYSDSATAKGRAAWEIVAKYAPDKNKSQASEIIKTWVKHGVIDRLDYDDPERRTTVKGLFVNADKRPK
jgi:hypothetical protein